jgi:hypothetical protein
VITAATNCVVVNNQTICSGSTVGFSAGLAVLLVIYLIIAVIGIIAAVKVVTKAGYSGWWVLIGFVPLVGTVFVLIFAFSKWPVISEVEMLRAQVAAGAGSRGYPTGPFGVGAGSSGPMDPASPITHETLPTFGQFIGGPAGQPGGAPGGAPGPAPGPAPAPGSLPPPGWFPAPGGAPGQLRYWDGAQWTDHFS